MTKIHRKDQQLVVVSCHIPADTVGMSISPLRHRSPLRTISSRLVGHHAFWRDDRFIDRNTTPTDFVLRDYRHVR